MPDAHSGFGMPIGGVLFAEDAVVPYAIGVDIGCGVQVARTNSLADSFTPDKLRNVLRQIQRDIPTGFSSRKAPVLKRERLLDVMGMDLPGKRSVHLGAFDGALNQLGTLGGGNHFLEVQRDPATNEIFFMLHSGSRSLGKKLCDVHAKVALAWCNANRHVFPDKDLASLLTDSTRAPPTGTRCRRAALGRGQPQGDDGRRRGGLSRKHAFGPRVRAARRRAPQLRGTRDALRHDRHGPPRGCRGRRG